MITKRKTIIGAKEYALTTDWTGRLLPNSKIKRCNTGDKHVHAAR